MNKNLWIEQGEEALLHVYNRFQLVLEKGEGVYLYDTDGKKYLDFAAGIAVASLGYNHPDFNHAMKEQMDKLIHTSNYFYNPPMIEAAQRLIEVSKMDDVFFTNSGTEAVEGAIKTAKKYAFLRDYHTDHEIIAMNQSFHGRSIGALSVTGNENYRKPFGPMPGVVKFAEYNQLESVKKLVNEKTCAIILETVQGEGGIYPATKEFLEGVKALCEEHDILLILDEIQCGIGRTGTMFAWEAYGIKPDIITCAKAMGNGFPVGAFAMTKKVSEKSLVPGDHGTTYGGNPLAGAAVSQVLKTIESEDLVTHTKELGEYLSSVLDGFVADYEIVTNRRGLGFMQGLELSINAANVVGKAIEEGLIVITANNNVLRFVPPLITQKEHIDEMAEILHKVLRQQTIESKSIN